MCDFDKDRYGSFSWVVWQGNPAWQTTKCTKSSRLCVTSIVVLTNDLTRPHTMTSSSSSSSHSFSLQFIHQLTYTYLVLYNYVYICVNVVLTFNEIPNYLCWKLVNANAVRTFNYSSSRFDQRIPSRFSSNQDNDDDLISNFFNFIFKISK